MAVASASNLAVENHACPHCAQPAGQDCITRSGRRYRAGDGVSVHAKRFGRLTQAEWDMCSVKLTRLDQHLVGSGFAAVLGAVLKGKGILP